MPETAWNFEYVTLDRCGEVTARSTGQAQQTVEVLAPGVYLELILIPAGSFQMGSRHEGGYADEQPVHPVFLDSFWMGKGPVTQAQWQAVVGKPLGKLPPCRFHGPDLPVENLCWREASAFCARLAKKTGRAYGLPSEAQWEYACRAGSGTPFSTGETITTDFANYVGEHTYRDEPQGIYRHTTTPAGTFPPNPFGLFDMHGNVWEFCADAWFEDYTGAPVDGSPRLHGKSPDRVARGGSWHETPAHCRSAVRLKVAEEDRLEYYGFRVMLKLV